MKILPFTKSHSFARFATLIIGALSFTLSIQANAEPWPFAPEADSGDEVAVHPASLAPLFESGEISWKTYPGYCKTELGIRHLEFADGFWKSTPDAQQIAEVRAQMETSGSVAEVLLLSHMPTAKQGGKKFQECADYVMDWAGIAAELGCHGVRIAFPEDESGADLPFEDLVGFLHSLSDQLNASGLSLYTENLAGRSRDPDFLIQLIERVGRDRLRLIVDTGNFEAGTHLEGFMKLLPYADRICLKYTQLDAQGNDTVIPNGAMLQLLRKSPFEGQIAIETLDRSHPAREVFLSVVSNLERQR